MAGATPEEALDAFVAPMRRAVWWLTDEPFLPLPAAPDPLTYVLAFRTNPVLESRQGYRIDWRISHAFRVIKDEGVRGPWKVRTTAYAYDLRLHGGPLLVSYHWHPEGASAITWPHVHLYTLKEPVPLYGAHFPTGRVALESVVRCLMMDFKVEPKTRGSKPRESTVFAELAASIGTFEE